MENHRKEFNLSHQNILNFVWRGIWIGIVSGTVVSLFRLLIELIFEHIVDIYKEAHHHLIPFIGLIILSLIALGIIGLLVKSEPDIKGSGIPHLEGELKGLLDPNWWSVLWKKFVAGLLAISMGFLLGREGPSIQLGAMTAKGLAQFLKTSRMEKRVFIASGAAAGLSAAFNAPIAGLLFVVEEIYHHFSRFVWITALVASLVANVISLNIFGLHPVLALPETLPHLPLSAYWLLPITGAFLGVFGLLYSQSTLNASRLYAKVGAILHIPSHFYGFIAFALLLPIAYYFPQLLGGGSSLIIALPTAHLSILVLTLYLLIRFIWSMISYGSGMPGGIFLPMLTLGAISGLLLGQSYLSLGFISQETLVLFLVLGMAGFFGAVSKAPLTAIILVTEMVGDLHQLMAMGVVTMSAYLIMDLLKGEPIYEALLEKLLPKEHGAPFQPTLMELVVSDKLAGQYVRSLNLPEQVLITTQVHHGKSELVSGNTRLHAGATLFIVVNESDIGNVRDQLL